MNLWLFRGFTGCAIANRAINADSIVNPTYETEFGDEQVRLEGIYNPQGTVDAYFVQYRADHQGQNPPLIDAARFAYTNANVRTFFDTLIGTATEHGWLYPPGTGFASVHGVNPPPAQQLKSKGARRTKKKSTH
jgi:hypothetical protein